MTALNYLKLIKNAEFLGRSRIDGHPMYRAWIGKNPRTRGLDTVKFKYDESNKTHSIIKEIDYVRGYQDTHGLVSDGIVGPVTIRVARYRNDDII